MTLDELYKDYGSLVIQAEVIQAKIMDTKKKIVEELNKEKK